MPTPRGPQLQTLDQALRRLYVHADQEEFPGRLLSAVAPLISSEITCYTELIPSEHGVKNVADRPDEGLDALLPVLADLQTQHPLLADFVENGQKGARTTSDYLSRAEWHRLDLYQHFYGAMGLEDQLITMLSAGPGTHLGLVFNRTNRSFTAEERQLVDLLRPHVALAYANAKAVSTLKGSTSEAPGVVDPEHGVVRLRRDGTVRFSSRRARALLARYWPSEKKPARSLPGPVQEWIRHTVRAVQRGKAHRARRFIHRRSSGGLCTMRLLEEPAGSGWLLLAEEQVPSRTSRGKNELPPRLRRVLERMLLGESEKEIANRLGLSSHTVHEYVKHLYRRLEVSSRAELMARHLAAARGDLARERRGVDSFP